MDLENEYAALCKFFFSIIMRKLMGDGNDISFSYTLLDNKRGSGDQITVV